MNTVHIRIAALACAVLLAACGGNGDGAAPPPAADTVPPSATASPEALVAWAGSLPEDDTREPLRLNGVELPASNSAEPAPVAR